MKLVKCIVQPDKADEMVKKLATIVSGLTMFEVRGHGRQKGHSVSYRGIEYQITLLPKITIETVTEDNKVDDVIRAVFEIARTGQIGDGRVFVLPVDENYHVRTGFMDMD
jgi:nitrogen regulatory protein PII